MMDFNEKSKHVDAFQTWPNEPDCMWMPRLNRVFKLNISVIIMSM